MLLMDVCILLVQATPALASSIAPVIPKVHDSMVYVTLPVTADHNHSLAESLGYNIGNC